MRVVKFLGLKIAEIGGALLVLYLCHFFFVWISPIIYGSSVANTSANYHWVGQWFLGLTFLVVAIVAPSLVCYFIYLWIKQNWEWSE